METGRSTRHALVVGAGIGGLATALALGRTGWRVTVLEQAAAIGEIGAGIRLSPNGDAC
ncbi:NAD(P)-binding protein [Streptomyces sp. DG1A-41]|uniref:NAD(P)-binding protein n=1 Tax=Streptomyces sp. DG1A-41 TaxID=3125779 RepID=UPI0030CD58E0